LWAVQNYGKDDVSPASLWHQCRRPFLWSNRYRRVFRFDSNWGPMAMQMGWWKCEPM